MIQQLSLYHLWRTPALERVQRLSKSMFALQHQASTALARNWKGSRKSSYNRMRRKLSRLRLTKSCLSVFGMREEKRGLWKKAFIGSLLGTVANPGNYISHFLRSKRLLGGSGCNVLFWGFCSSYFWGRFLKAVDGTYGICAYFWL